MDQRVLFLSLSLLSLFWGCNSTKAIKVEGPGVAITSLSKKTFIHVSYLEFQGGKVACNGLIYVNKGKAIVFDTPNTNEDAQTLIRLIETQLQAKVEAVVINHFHIDCLGGLAAFHEAGATSYANQRTIELAMKDWEVLPKNGFEGYCEIEISGKKVINEFIGKGHTHDNIISYIPDEKVMFGGSMIKSLRARKGNLADASLSDWSNTVKKVKAKYGDLKYVVPGHGPAGGVELLDYTIALFKQ